MRLRITKPTDIPDELLCALIMLSALIGNVSPMAGRLSNLAGIALAVIILLDCVTKERTRFVIWILFAGSLLLALLNVVFVGQDPLTKYIVTGITLFSVGLYFNLADTLDYRLWRNVYLAAAAFIMFIWSRSPNGYILFYNLGRNYVSVFLLSYMMPMQLAADKNQINIPIGYYVLNVICSISAVGRGGIVCTMLLLGMILVHRLLINERLTIRQKARNIVFSLMLAEGGCIILAGFWSSIAPKLFSRFIQDNTISDNSRMTILIDYLKAVDTLPKLLLGTRSGDIEFLKLWEGNIHNSYLMTHASYGLIGAVILLFGIAACIVMLLMNGHTELGLFLIAFSARSLIDTLFQAKPGDVTAWYCIIYTFTHLKIGHEFYITTGRREPYNG